MALIRVAPPSPALRPFAAVGAVTRSAMVFARGRGGYLFVRRSNIDYQTEVGDPATNSIVGAVVGWIARNFPDAPVKILDESKPEGTPITRASTGPGAMLRLLEKPNAYFSGVLQWMATVIDFITDGNAYWIKVRNGSGRVVALWWVPQRMMEPRWPESDPSVFVGWYEYTVDGIPWVVRPADVVHFRNGIDGMNTRKGRAPLKSLFTEIFTDVEAAAFTASLLRNLGIPGVVLSPANTTSGVGFGQLAGNADGIKQKFMDTFGGDHRGEPLVFTHPTEAKVLSWSPEQMNLRELRRIPEERVSAVLGVPAGVAGLGAGLDRNTFTNYGEANKAAYTQAVIPMHRLIAAELEAQLLPDFTTALLDVLDVVFDASVVAAMQEAAGEVWKRAESAAKGGLMMRSDFKRMTGQKPAADGSDDVYLLPQQVRVVAAASGKGEPKVLLPSGNPTAAPTRPGLPPGQAPAGLLASGLEEVVVVNVDAAVDADRIAALALTAGREVRCDRGHLLAELATAPYRFTCGKCKTTVEALSA